MPAAAPVNPTGIEVPDKRAQPWKKILAGVTFNKTTSSPSDEEIVKTGGPCDVLTNFFAS